MKNLQIGQMVKVTFGVLDGTRGHVWEFESEVIDIVDNDRNTGVWVDHPELRGEDMLFVELTNPHINKVEVIVEKEIEIDEDQDIKSIKKDLLKAIKYEEDVTVKVMVYDCFENTRSLDGSDDQTYDVEINYYIDGEYADGFVNQTFVGRFQDDADALKMAEKRAKAVLKTVKGWFQYNDDVAVENTIEVYHV